MARLIVNGSLFPPVRKEAERVAPELERRRVARETRLMYARRPSRHCLRAPGGIRLNEHLANENGSLVFHHACKLGLEGIVLKRKDSRYSSGRSPRWIKSKNPNAPAVKREAEEVVECQRLSVTTPKHRSNDSSTAREASKYRTCNWLVVYQGQPAKER